jgi:phage repressor protein C with HTH and peptisase S24 domain
MTDQNTTTQLSNYDWEAFAERLKFALGKQSYRRVAQLIGMSDSGFKRYVNYGSIPPIDKALEIAQVLNVDFIWLCTGVGTPSASDNQAEYKATFTAKDAVVWIDSTPLQKKIDMSNQENMLSQRLPFSVDYLRDNGFNQNNLALIRMVGDSMYPTISTKETMLVELLDTEENFPKALADDIYVITVNGQIYIKRIQRTRGGFRVTSDNPRYEAYTLLDDEITNDYKVVARWTSKKY